MGSSSTELPSCSSIQDSISVCIIPQGVHGLVRATLLNSPTGVLAVLPGSTLSGCPSLPYSVPCQPWLLVAGAVTMISYRSSQSRKIVHRVLHAVDLSFPPVPDTFIVGNQLRVYGKSSLTHSSSVMVAAWYRTAVPSFVSQMPRPVTLR